MFLKYIDFYNSSNEPLIFCKLIKNKKAIRLQTNRFHFLIFNGFQFPTLQILLRVITQFVPDLHVISDSVFEIDRYFCPDIQFLN